MPRPATLSRLALGVLCALGAGAAGAVAGPVNVAPASYDMPNGNTGSYQYHDDTYSGSGCTTCDGASLVGGLGDLTDGVIATDNWFVTEAPSGPGPYVGWASVDPVITFRWTNPVIVRSVTFHFDDADGFGGVSAPASVTVGGTLFTIDDPVGSAPFAYTAAIDFEGSDLVVQVERRDSWVFLSEVTFSATPVPEPASALLLAGGLALVGSCAAARRRQAR